MKELFHLLLFEIVNLHNASWWLFIIPYLTCTHGLTVNHSDLKRKWNKTKVTDAIIFSL